MWFDCDAVVGGGGQREPFPSTGQQDKQLDPRQHPADVVPARERTLGVSFDTLFTGAAAFNSSRK